MKNLAKPYKLNSNKISRLYFVGLLFLCLSVILGLTFGSTTLSLLEIWQAAVTDSQRNNAASRIFYYVRLPRTVSCLVCGAALSVSGVIIQSVLANKLASPSIIGVNSGAGLAVTICAALEIYGGWQLSIFSFLGAFVAVMIVSLSAGKWGASRGTVILIGVALNSLLNAISDAIVTFSPDISVMSSDFKIGDFSSVTYQKLIPATVIILITLLLLFSLTNELEVLTLGGDNARGLGLNTKVMGMVFLMLAAILAGCAVSMAGLLSFVGLIVPHIIRRIAGRKILHILGLSALFGAGFVCICDTIARTVFSPYEIPVGIIMAFLGAPFFVFILIKGKGGHVK